MAMRPGFYTTTSAVRSVQAVLEQQGKETWVALVLLKEVVHPLAGG